MENTNAASLFAALSHQTRLSIFRLLVQAGPTGVAAGEIGSALKVPPATVSFHLKELAHAGLIESRQQSRFVFYSANYSKMNELIAFLTENCCAADGLSCGPGCVPATAPGKAPSRAKSPVRRKAPART